MRSSDSFGAVSWLPYAVGGAAVVIALAGLLVLTTRGGGGAGGGPVASPDEPPPKARLFTPPTRSDGALEVMPVTFTDGSTAEVVYDSRLDLASLGLVPHGSATLEGCCRRQYLVDYGEQGTFYRGPPVASYPGADGKTAAVHRGLEGDPGLYLIFHFGSWTLGLSDGSGKGRLTVAQRGVWASSLTGAQTPDGFLVVEAKSPLAAEPAGGVAGPQIEIGNIRQKGVLLVPGPCRPGSSPGAEQRDGMTVVRSKLVGKFETAVMCAEEARIAAYVYGDADFVGSVAGSLRFRNVRLAS